MHAVWGVCYEAACLLCLLRRAVLWHPVPASELAGSPSGLRVSAQAASRAMTLPSEPSPMRKRARTDNQTVPPDSVLSLQEATTYVSFYVLSNSTSQYYQSGTTIVKGPLGFYGQPQDGNVARLTQLAWSSSLTSGEGKPLAKKYYIAIPGVLDEGDALGDVLLEFADILFNTANPRLITYNMELNAGLLGAEMTRCRLHGTRKRFEQLVCAQGFDLMDPCLVTWLRGTGFVFPVLQDLAQVLLPISLDGFRESGTGGDKALLYMNLAGALRVLGMTVCQRHGHKPIRVSCNRMRDNGEYDFECSRCSALL